MGLLDNIFGERGSEERLRMKMGLMGLTHRPNTALMQQWSNDLSAMQDERKTQEASNRTIEWLRSQAAQYPQLAPLLGAAESGSVDMGTVVNTAFQVIQEANKPADPWANTKVVGGDVVRMSDAGPEVIYSAPDAQGGVTYGLTPQRYVRPDGTIGLGVLGNDGTFKEIALPDGATPAPNVDRVDAGDRWILMDQQGNVVGEQPKNLEDAAAATERGKAIGTAQGEAITGEGAAVQKAMQGISLIESIVNDPALGSITGMIQGRMPPLTQAGTDLSVKIDQLQGQAFLEAFESLKGGGAITEREGQAAQAAIARLNRAQSEGEYVRALRELQGILQLGVRRAQEKASSARGETPAQNNDDPLGLFE